MVSIIPLIFDYPRSFFYDAFENHYYGLFLELFTSTLADGFSLEFEWQLVSSIIIII